MYFICQLTAALPSACLLANAQPDADALRYDLGPFAIALHRDLALARRRADQADRIALRRRGCRPARCR